MAIKIASADAIVTVNEHGAELVSFIDKTTGKEYMWSGDAKYWGRHAPVLFPIVGRLKDDIYKVDGQEYHLSQHGFARDLNFEVLNQSKNHAIFELHSSDETKKVYPFDFILRIGFELTGRSLKVDYQVENPSNEKIWFGIGGHPAFAVPMDDKHYYDDYQVLLSPKATRNIIPLKGAYTDIDNSKEERESEIAINHELFKNDAVIFDLAEEPTEIELSDNEHQHGVKLNVFDAKYVGVWSSYPQEGQFVCLEPWWGLADTVNSDQDFKHKFASNELDEHQTFNSSYQITIF